MNCLHFITRWTLCALLAIAGSMIFAGPAQAQTSATAAYDLAAPARGFVTIAPGRELYVDYIKPAPGKPTVVLVNGLTYSTYQWTLFVDQLRGNGLGILRYDPMGMGQTLLKYGIPNGPVAYKDQVNDLRLLLDAEGLTSPVHVLGLSYGGAIALEFGHEFPARVATLILMSPFVAPIEAQDSMIKQQVMQTRIMFPFNTASDDELYDYFLHMNILQTYPIAEPIVLENPLKLEGIFRVVQGARKFLASSITKYEPNVGVHLMIGGSDQYIATAVHDAFWDALQTGTRRSRLYITGSEHKIPEAVPAFAASWVRRIINGEAALQAGASFRADPATGAIQQLPVPAKR